MHLRRRLGVRRHLEFEFEPVDDAPVAGLHDQVGRTQQRDRTRRHRLAEAAIDLAARALGEERPELILRAPQHRGPCDDVLRDRVLHEQIGRDDRHLAARERFVVEHAARAAPMVGVGVGEDDGGDRTLSAVLEIELHRGARALDRGQRVHHDDAAIALDQRHVGDVEPAHLVDAGHHLEQAVLHVEARLPPQARIDGGGRLFLGQKAVGLEAPDHPPCAVGMIRACSIVPRKPRAASSKSRVSENGSAFSIASCCAMTEAEASFGVSLGLRCGCLGHVFPP